MNYVKIIDDRSRVRVAGGFAFGAPNNLLNATAGTSMLTVAAKKENNGCLEVADNSDQAPGSGGGILFSGRWDAGPALTSCAGIQAYKESNVAGQYGFGLALLSRAQGTGGPANRWQVSPTGHFVPFASNIYDIGQSALRVGNGFFGALDTNGQVGLALNNASSNLILYSNGGAGPPTVSNRSAGTKIVLYQSVSSASVDYALGIDGGTLWSSVSTASNHFKWYGGTNLMMSLMGGTNGGSLVLGPTTGALPATATDGFLYIRTASGPPTGTPTAFTGTVPMVYDTTNNHFYIYNGEWKKVKLT